MAQVGPVCCFSNRCPNLGIFTKTYWQPYDCKRTWRFSGSVSGGCVESAVVRECLDLIQNKTKYKKIEFKVSNESAWEVGLACGGEIAVYLETIQ